jgi:predicted NAD/FAD-binding protein
MALIELSRFDEAIAAAKKDQADTLLTDPVLRHRPPIDHD